MRAFLLLLLIPVILCQASCEVVNSDHARKPLTEATAPANIEVLAFTAKWCPACQRDKPRLEELRRQGVNLTEIDADEHPELIRKHRIKQLPTYIVLEDGVEVERTGDIILIISIVSAILKIVIPLLFPLL
jgi:thiol-disulfide isomerase/thioredoxin